MKRLIQLIRNWFKEFFICFPYVSTIVFFVLTYGLFSAFGTLSYYSLYEWNETLIGEAPRNFFALILVTVGYGAIIIFPQIIFEIYRSRKMKLMLARRVIPYGKIIKRFSIPFPRYSEFHIFDKTDLSGRNAINFMIIWMYFSVFLFGFFVMLRVSEVDDIVAVPALIITAVMWGIALSVFLRLISNVYLRKLFWGKVNLVNLVRDETLLMEENDASAHKKSIFRMRFLIISESFLMIFIMLALYFLVSMVVLIIISVCTAVFTLAVMIYYTLKKYEIEEELQNISYKFRE